MIVIKREILHFYQRLPWYAKNKYLLTLAFFIVWMMFFDQNDVFTQRKRAKQLKSLQTQRDYYIAEIDRVKMDKEALFRSNESIEKFAREKYFMKKDNEDIFIIRR